ncbi:MAG TPA: signal peptidase I [Acidimicrobiales bacterium]|nr:signal peptidase I [Acidimicrobiales bacterium]
MLGGVVAAAVAAGMLATAAAVVVFHVGVRPVLSGSMRPTFGPGSLLVTRQVPVEDVRPGEVIVFHAPAGQGDYAHRVTSLTPADRPVVTTKGDANPAVDPWKAELLGRSVPVVVTSVPGVGRVLSAAQEAGIRVALIVFAGLVVLVVGVGGILGPRPPAGAHARPRLVV